jgi:hypothetical protein
MMSVSANVCNPMVLNSVVPRGNPSSGNEEPILALISTARSLLALCTQYDLQQEGKICVHYAIKCHGCYKYIVESWHLNGTSDMSMQACSAQLLDPVAKRSLDAVCCWCLLDVRFTYQEAAVCVAKHTSATPAPIQASLAIGPCLCTGKHIYIAIKLFESHGDIDYDRL